MASPEIATPLTHLCLQKMRRETQQGLLRAQQPTQGPQAAYPYRGLRDLDEAQPIFVDSDELRKTR